MIPSLIVKETTICVFLIVLLSSIISFFIKRFFEKTDRLQENVENITKETIELEAEVSTLNKEIDDIKKLLIRNAFDKDL